MDIDFVGDVYTNSAYTLPPTWTNLPFVSNKHADAKFTGSDSEILKQVLSKDSDDFLPWQEIQLPSLGLFYGDKMPEGKISIRAMGVNAEKIMSTSRLAQTGESIELLFKQCVKLPNGLDSLDLLVSDRFYIFYYIRGITHGNSYTFTYKCPHCSEDSLHEFDMRRLAYSIKLAKPELGQEPFKVILPYMSEVVGKDFWVKIRLMRGRDSEIIRRDGLKKKKLDKNALDETIIKNLNLIITEVMGSTDRSVIDNIISKLHARDHAFIREKLEEYSPALDTTVTIPCTRCNGEVSIDLPITEDFFRPSKSV